MEGESLPEVGANAHGGCPGRSPRPAPQRTGGSTPGGSLAPAGCRLLTRGAWPPTGAVNGARGREAAGGGPPGSPVVSEAALPRPGVPPRRAFASGVVAPRGVPFPRVVPPGTATEAPCPSAPRLSGLGPSRPWFRWRWLRLHRRGEREGGTPQRFLAKDAWSDPSLGVPSVSPGGVGLPPGRPCVPFGGPVPVR